MEEAAKLACVAGRPHLRAARHGETPKEGRQLAAAAPLGHRNAVIMQYSRIRRKKSGMFKYGWTPSAGSLEVWPKNTRLSSPFRGGCERGGKKRTERATSTHKTRATRSKRPREARQSSEPYPRRAADSRREAMGTTTAKDDKTAFGLYPKPRPGSAKRTSRRRDAWT